MKRFLACIGGFFASMGRGVGRFFLRIARFAKRHKVVSAFGLVVALGGVAALTFFTGFWNPVQATGAAMPEMTQLEKMDLELTVTATGTLQSASTKQVSSSLSYEVMEVMVQVGDSVQVGDTLCLLDTAELEDTIADMKNQISEAVASDKLQLEQAQRKLQTASENRSYNYSKNDASAQTALAELNTANTALAAANTPLTSAQAEVDRLGTLQANYNSWSPGPVAAADAADAATSQAESAEVNPYQAEYDAAVAADAFNQAATALQTAKEAQSKASAAVATAQSAYNKAVETRDNTYRSDTQNVENAQDSVDTQKQKDSAETLRKELETYEEQLEKCTVTAPIAGTITALTAEVGESAGGSGSEATAAGGTTDSAASASTSSGAGLFTIEDLNQLEIPASIPEYDALTLCEGMSVHITSDAVDDKTWTGQVASISPTASDSSGNFTATVRVTSAPEGLTSGMSAKLEIVTEASTGVYAVPFDAVVTNDAGESVVYAVEGMGDRSEAENAQPLAAPTAQSEAETGPARTEILVETGLETDYYVEITGESLQDGLWILNDPNGNNVTTASTEDEQEEQTGLEGLEGLGGGPGGGDMGGGTPPSGGAPPEGGTRS